MKTFVCIVLFSLISTTIFAQKQYLENANEAKLLSHKMAQAYFNKEYNVITEALKNYKYNNGYPESYQELQNNFIISNPPGPEQPQYDNPLSFFKSTELKLGEIGIKTTYIIQYSRSIIKLTSVYLKAEKGWYLHSFSQSNDFESEFK